MKLLVFLACPATTSFLAICGANYRSFIFCINNNNKIVVVVVVVVGNMTALQPNVTTFTSHVWN